MSLSSGLYDLHGQCGRILPPSFEQAATSPNRHGNGLSLDPRPDLNHPRTLHQRLPCLVRASMPPGMSG